LSKNQTEADYITYHAAKFEENVINTAAVRSQIRSVAILLDDPVVICEWRGTSYHEYPAKSMAMHGEELPIAAHVKS
jgi:hypothetical protein